MKVNWRRLFSFSVSDNEYLIDSKDKIEFIGCKKTEYSCLSYLPAINHYFRESDKHFINKDFNLSIDALDKAHQIAGELRDVDCLTCAKFFQVTAVQSLENVHSELEKMTRGLFATRRYQPCYEKAEELLKQLRVNKKTTPSCQPIKENSSVLPAFSM